MIFLITLILQFCFTTNLSIEFAVFDPECLSEFLYFLWVPDAGLVCGVVAANKWVSFVIAFYFEKNDVPRIGIYLSLSSLRVYLWSKLPGWQLSWCSGWGVCLLLILVYRLKYHSQLMWNTFILHIFLSILLSQTPQTSANWLY